MAYSDGKLQHTFTTHFCKNISVNIWSDILYSINISHTVILSSTQSFGGSRRWKHQMVCFHPTSPLLSRISSNPRTWRRCISWFFLCSTCIEGVEGCIRYLQYTKHIQPSKSGHCHWSSCPPPSSSCGCLIRTGWTGWYGGRWHCDKNCWLGLWVHRREPGCRLSGCQGTRVKLAGCPITRVRQIPGWKVIRVESYPGAIYPGAKSCFLHFLSL